MKQTMNTRQKFVKLKTDMFKYTEIVILNAKASSFNNDRI